MHKSYYSMKRFALFSLLLLIPSVVFAVEKVDKIITTFGKIIAQATPVVVALALLFFHCVVNY